MSLSGSAGRSLDLKLGIRALPLSLARVAAPSLALSGTLDGEAEVRGSTARPEGHYALSIARLVTPETRKAGLPPIDAKASGTLSEGQAGIDGRVSAGRGAEMTLTGSLPIDPGGALALKARGTVEAALVNTLLRTGGQRLTGRIAIDAGVAGTLEVPRVEGDAIAHRRQLHRPAPGHPAHQHRGPGDRARQRHRAGATYRRTHNGGTLWAEGRVAVEPDAGFPGSLRLSAERAEFVSTPLMTAIASLNLTMSGPLARTPHVTGRVDVVSIDVSVPDRLPATVQPLPGIRYVNTPPELRARLIAKAEHKAQVRRPSAGLSRPHPSTPLLTWR